MKRRVLILGGADGVTSRVAKAIAASDWAEPVPGPASPTDLGTERLRGIDSIFNGVAGSSDSITAWSKALYGALTGMTQPTRVVHLSSMTVYGSRSGTVSETDELLPDLGAYGAAQIEAERLAARHPHSVRLRPGCEYGPDCQPWSGRIARLLRAHRLGDLGPAGDGVCNLLYVDDLVTAVLGALRQPEIEGLGFNLAMRSPPSWNEYFVRFGRQLGAVPVSRIGARRLKLERRLLAPALKAMELVERRLRGTAALTPPAMTSSLLALCSQAITLDVRKAEALLGLQWTDLQTGLRQTVAALGPG